MTIVPFVRIAQQAQRIKELEAENEALAVYVSSLIDKLTDLKMDEVNAKIAARERDLWVLLGGPK